MEDYPRSCESVAAALESEDESVTLNGTLENLRSKLQKVGGSKCQKAGGGGASDGRTGVRNSSNESQNRHLGNNNNGVTVKKKKERRAIESSESSESKEDEDGNTPKTPPTCSECGKTFSSMKALYGHLRCHPQRGYRGAYRPQGAQNKLQTRALVRVDGDVDPAVINAALILIQMSRDTTNRSQDRKSKGTLDDTIMEIDEKDLLALQLIDAIHSENRKAIKDESIDEVEANKDRSQSEFESKLKEEEEEEKVRDLESVNELASQPAAQSRRYRCRTCNKSFSTHQALGGHKASHNKSKNNAEQVMAEDGELVNGEALVDSNGVVPGAATGAHRCTLCQATFPTGQALGGHKRKHWNGPMNHPTKRSSWAASPPSPPSKSVEKANGGLLLDFDLNELPKFEAEEP